MRGVYIGRRRGEGTVNADARGHYRRKEARIL